MYTMYWALLCYYVLHFSTFIKLNTWLTYKLGLVAGYSRAEDIGVPGGAGLGPELGPRRGGQGGQVGRGVAGLHPQ